MVSLVTADSSLYTADSDCVKADGYNGCVVEQDQTLLGSGGPGHYALELAEERMERIRREDNDIITIIRIMLTKGML